MKYNTYEEYIQKFAELCNFFWFVLNPDWEPDGFMHTSDECRRLAGEVFDLLKIEHYAWQPTFNKEVLLGLIERGRERKP